MSDLHRAKEEHAIFEQIEVVVHPQSIVHSMVAFKDGSVIAQMGIPDMQGAIAYALSHPQRLPLKMPLPGVTSHQVKQPVQGLIS